MRQCGQTDRQKPEAMCAAKCHQISSKPLSMILIYLCIMYVMYSKIEEISIYMWLYIQKNKTCTWVYNMRGIVCTYVLLISYRGGGTCENWQPGIVDTF